ncbi:hypothetical protein SLEP1_g23684 [Rubroshorea leprosula]|uniref:Uncharacterized protein n=1 Tax=Rubroshorea leprosula TaxID=152421 RepID=A0AAV5JLY3_9ROSI|nr:hypothetical protein SLEP1_g23684 [Rubroshorea leprosula]
MKSQEVWVQLNFEDVKEAKLKSRAQNQRQPQAKHKHEEFQGTKEQKNTGCI